MGYSTLENILHCKVVSWEPELPETRIVTIRTPCYVYVDILPNMKSIFSVPVVPVIPFGGEKRCSMPAECRYTRRCFHKVTKNPVQFLTAREKI